MNIMQTLNDCGINPFAVELFWESWSRHKTTPCHPISFQFRDAVITIKKVSDFKQSAAERDELLVMVKRLRERLWIHGNTYSQDVEAVLETDRLIAKIEGDKK